MRFVAVLTVSLMLSVFGCVHPLAEGSVESKDDVSCNAELGAVFYWDEAGALHMHCNTVKEALADPFVLEMWRRACEEDGWVQYCLPPQTR
jgi:hypothetical protein